MENHADGNVEIETETDPPSKRGCTFTFVATLTACFELICSIMLLVYVTTRFMDIGHRLKYGTHRFPVFHNSFYDGSNKSDLELLRIYYIWGTILTSGGIILSAFLLVMSIQRSPSGLYAWLVTAAIAYVGNITLVCLLFFDGRWVIFLFIIIITVFKMWEFAVVLATITEISFEKLKPEERSPEYYYDLRASKDFQMQKVLQSENYERLKLTNGTVTGNGTNLDSLPFHIPPNYPVTPYETTQRPMSNKLSGGKFAASREK